MNSFKKQKNRGFFASCAESQKRISCSALGVAQGFVLVGSKSAFEFPRSILCIVKISVFSLSYIKILAYLKN